MSAADFYGLLLSFPHIWQNLDWSHPRSFKRRSILVSSACIHSHQATCGGGSPFYYPNKSPGPFHFQLFVHVCLRQCVSHLLFKFQRIWTGRTTMLRYRRVTSEHSTQSLFSLTFHFWPLAVTCGHFPDQITLRAFKIWASPSIRVVQQVLNNQSYKEQSGWFIGDATAPV